MINPEDQKIKNLEGVGVIQQEALEKHNVQTPTEQVINQRIAPNEVGYIDPSPISIQTEKAG